MYIIWHDSWPKKTVWYTHADVKWNRTPGNKKKWRVLDTGCSWTQLFFITLSPFESTWLTN
jgi:hypothetical protein